MKLAFALLDSEPLQRRLRRKRDAAADFAASVVHMTKVGSEAAKVHSLVGHLYLSKSGWILLSVPNQLVQGAFDALDENGAELPLDDKGRLNAHISVMRPEELATIGGPDKISERGHPFYYTLGPLKEVTPSEWGEMSKVWYLTVESPELKQLRKSYGLTALPHNDEYDFHITIAVRKKNVLGPNETSKLGCLEALLQEMDLDHAKPFRPPGYGVAA